MTMTSGYALAVVLALAFLVLVVLLLRGRRIREKYAAIWLVLGTAVVVLALFPRLAFWLAGVAGVEQPSNLLFAVGSAVLLAVCIQLSSEISSLEEETRTLAEEIALLRLEVHDRATAADGADDAHRTADAGHLDPVPTDNLEPRDEL